MRTNRREQQHRATTLSFFLLLSRAHKAQNDALLSILETCWQEEMDKTKLKDLLGEKLLQGNDSTNELKEIPTHQLDGKTVALYFSSVE